MAKITIMKGLPASGKSTKAKELMQVGNTVRINKDLLRTMLHFDVFDHRKEGHTQDAARKLADWFLTNGVNVIIDDTNLNPKILQSWKDLAKIHNAKIEYCDMTDVSVMECVERDMVRDKKVGASVIFKMAWQYLDYMKGEKVVICDLDGTLCNIEHRLHYVKQEKKDWKNFFAELEDDTLREEVLDMLNTEIDMGAVVVFVSGRSEDHRDATVRWLKAHVLDRLHKVGARGLLMRAAHDNRPDTDVKAEIYDKYLSKLNVVKVFDDRPSVIRMWREKGLLVEDVGKGIEF